MPLLGLGLASIVASLLVRLQVWFRYPERGGSNRDWRKLSEGSTLHREGQMSSEQREIADGTLVVRSQESGDSRVIAFAGELDLANAGTAESALEGSLADSSTPVIVDMRELEFIDSTGIALLVSTLSRNDGETRVSFIPSDFPAVTRVLELTGLAERLPLAEA